MILNGNDNNETIIVGDIKNNKVSIDVANLDFITQILSTSLYSNPLGSFLRETVSNAWDSHVEACIDKPILIQIGSDAELRNFIKIQDFGVGLSPERFSTIYMNMGSSTKREDNTQVGGFGIGRMSGLSYTDEVYITSNYNGVKYKYLMYKDGMSIHIDELVSIPTSDDNGVEVLVYVNKDTHLSNIYTEIKTQLSNFENLYLDASNLNRDQHYSAGFLNNIEKFNNLGIKHYKNFSVNSEYRDTDIKVRIGKVNYPLVTSSIMDYIKREDIRFLNTPIFLTFEIGEISVTPNREAILYSKDTINKIANKFTEAVKELRAIEEIELTRDFTNLLDYSNRKDGSVQIYLLNRTDAHDPVVYTTNTQNVDIFNKISYRGAKYSIDFAELANKFMYRRIRYINPNCMTHYVEYNRIQSIEKAKYCSIYEITKKEGNFIKASKEHSALFKDYLVEKYKYKYIVPESTTYISIYKIVLEFMCEYADPENYYYIKVDASMFKLYAKLIFQYVVECIGDVPLVNKEMIDDAFIIARKARMAAARKNANSTLTCSNTDIVVYPLKLSNSNYISINDISAPVISSDSYRQSVSEFYKFYNKKTVIYSDKGDLRFETIYFILKKMKLCDLDYSTIFVAVAPTKLKHFKTLADPDVTFLSIDEFIAKNKDIFKKIVTTRFILDKYSILLRKLYNYQMYTKDISEELYTIVKTVHNYVQDHIVSDSEFTSKDRYALYKNIQDLLDDNTYKDTEILDYIDKHHTSIDNASILPILLSPSNNDAKLNFIYTYVKEKNLFPVNDKTPEVKDNN